MPGQSRRAAHRIACLLLALAAAACGGGQGAAPGGGGAGGATPAPEKAARTDRFIWGTQQEPDSLNPLLSDMFASTQVCNLVHGFFTRIDDKMQLQPDLIVDVPSTENGGVSSDYLTYTYKLRKDATFSDGRPVTSKDVLFTFNLVMDPKVNVVTRDLYDRVQSVDTPDDQTVVFHLKEVFAPFDLVFNDYPILPEHVLKGSSDVNRDPYNRNPIGAGPYTLKKWDSGSLMQFAARADYFRGKPKIDEIDIKIIPEEQVLMVQLQTGEIDYYDGANTTQYDELRKIPGITVFTTPAASWEHIDINCGKPILADVRVRKALAYAIDRDQISQKVFRGLWKPAYSDQTPLSWAYNKDNESILVHDVDKAKQLLDEAGWKDSDGDGVRDKDGQKLALEITTTTGKPLRERTEQVIQEQLKPIGVALTIKNYNPTLFFGMPQEKGILKTGNYDLAIFTWISSSDPDDYSIFASDQTPPAGQNSTFWKNDKCTDLMRKGRLVAERDKRIPIYREIQRILAEEVPTIPLLYWVNIDPVTARMKGFKPNPSRQGNTWNVWEWELSPTVPSAS